MAKFLVTHAISPNDALFMLRRNIAVWAKGGRWRYLVRPEVKCHRGRWWAYARTERY